MNFTTEKGGSVETVSSSTLSNTSASSVCQTDMDRTSVATLQDSEEKNSLLFRECQNWSTDCTTDNAETEITEIRKTKKMVRRYRLNSTNYYYSNNSRYFSADETEHDHKHYTESDRAVSVRSFRNTRLPSSDHIVQAVGEILNEDEFRNKIR